jgi:hypothetical protein
MATEERAAARILVSIAVLAAAGAVAGFFWKGWTWSAGFLLGALVSYLNFRWLKALTESLGTNAAKPPRKRTAVFLGLRYLILGAAAYVIVNYSPLNLAAALTGLFVAVAAVVIEAIFELVYA